MEGAAGGDHGVDAVLFFDLELDEEGFAAGERAGDGGDDVCAPANGTVRAYRAAVGAQVEEGVQLIDFEQES